MSKTFVSVYFVPFGKRERISFPDLEVVFPDLNIGKINRKEFSSRFDEQRYIEMRPNICEICGVVKQKLISDKRQEFIREVGIRYDDTKHNNTETHLNLDLITRYPKAMGKQKHFLKETHQLFLKTKGIQTLHVLLSIPGSSIRRSIVILPTLKDKMYHQEQNKFLKKLKNRKLTKEDEIKFKKKFDHYVEYISS